MNLRSLLLSIALAASAACTISVPNQTQCTTDANCPKDDKGVQQICGEDGFCRDDNGCPGNPLFIRRCNGVCADFRTTLNCGNCGTACGPDEQCSPSSTSGGTYSCQPHCAPGLDVCAQNGATSCRDLTADPDNCGTCGNACQAGFGCQKDSVTGQGRCVIKCPAGENACGANCADLQNDNNNCGACGRACSGSEKCVAGACKSICTATQTQCGAGNCVDTSRDRDNCGQCGRKCDSGQVCVNGGCALSCPAGTDVCNGSCVNEAADADNCGGCTTGSIKAGAGRNNFACDPGFACEPHGPNGSGVCELSCQAGQTICDGKCVDTSIDGNNCGGCGSAGAQFVCGAGQLCQGGTCQLTCLPSQANCNGKCVDKTSDFFNCGACGNACSGGQVCSNSTCTTSCPPLPQQNCGGSCRDTSTDPQNCGSCGNACSGGKVCAGGVCSVSCPAGSVNCNGVCVDPTHDNANCGACGQSCAAGTSCKPVVNGGVTTGACQADCASGFTACGGACKDTAHDPANCGSCGNACSADQTCVDGNCTLTCPSTMTVCSAGGGAQACKDTKSDPANCGTCGFACQGGQVCVNGGCQTSCPAGQVECNGTCTNTTYDPAHCGSCATSCPSAANATPYCAAGACAQSCQGTFADCDGSGTNGCESNLANDPAHCGGCLNQCKAQDNAAPVCATGKCDLSCQPGYGNCDADLSNGCEASTQSDAAHCGGCGAQFVCGAAQPYCSGGTCVASLTGVQQNVSIAALQAQGWQQCHGDTFSDSKLISTIQTACNQNNVLIGCRVAGSGTLLVAAAGQASDVFFATGAGNAAHVANGVAWYFDGNSSWGFAPAGAAINRAPCDIAGGTQDGFAAGSGSQRLCWLTSNGTLAAGLRCGDHESLGPGSTYERLVFTKP